MLCRLCFLVHLFDQLLELKILLGKIAGHLGQDPCPARLGVAQSWLTLVTSQYCSTLRAPIREPKLV